MSEIPDTSGATVYSFADLPGIIPAVPEDGPLKALSGRWVVEKELIPQELAIEAGQIASWIVKHADRLPYANSRPKPTRSHTTVGIFDPEEYAPEQTILGYDASTEFAAPLLRVIEAVQHRWPRMRGANFAFIDSYSPLDGGLGYHQDLYHRDVAIVELLFGSIISLYDRVGDRYVEHVQNEGDAYLMHQTRSRKWSPDHGVGMPWARLSLRMSVPTHRQVALDLKNSRQKK